MDVVILKTTTERFIEKAKSVHGNKYDYSKVVYVNAKTKVEIICPIHGMFEQSPDKHVNSMCGCPQCAGNKQATTEAFVQKARLIHGFTYDYSLVKYVNNRVDVGIICPEHGLFWQSPTNHLSGRGCPHCANNIKLSTDEFLAKAKAIHGKKYDYSQVIYCGNRIPIKIICPIHGVFEQRPYAHLSGVGCPICGKLSSKEHRDASMVHKKATATCLSKYGVENPMFVPEIREKHKLSVNSEIVNDKRIQTKRTNNSFNTSLCEYQLGVLLKSLFGEDDVFNNYKSEKYPFRCDYYIQSRDLYIELNAHWSHGGHWYTDDDNVIITKWLSKSKFYQSAAMTFSVRDVTKRNVARHNCLNYLVFWKCDLSDVQDWISHGCPDGHDWEKEYSWLL